MFKRSRNRIILSIMGSLILLFAATLTVIMAASYSDIRKNNSEMLRRYAELYTFDGGQGGSGDIPGNVPDLPGGDQMSAAQGVSDGGPGRRDADMISDGRDAQGGSMPGGRWGRGPIDDRPDYKLATFYSVVFENDGSLRYVDNANKALYSSGDLEEIAREIVDGGKTSGSRGSLSYIVSQRDGCTLVAFLDNTTTESGMRTLLRYVLIVGAAALVILFFLSLLLSRRIIRPLEENDTKQRQFISDAGHELKTPVAVIGANAELLQRQVGDNEWLANIRYENDRMGGLLRQMLDLSRAESADTAAADEMVDLTRVVNGEVLAFESLAYERGRTIVSRVEDGIMLRGSGASLTQLVSVLLDNAVRYSTGSSIDVSLRREGHAAVLTVENDGDEIPKEKLEHIFDRFYRVDEARSGDDPHYGLGLSIAKAVAEKHGGDIRVSCGDGRVAFKVSLPTKK